VVLTVPADGSSPYLGRNEGSFVYPDFQLQVIADLEVFDYPGPKALLGEVLLLNGRDYLEIMLISLNDCISIVLVSQISSDEADLIADRNMVTGF
jgi:hypothetical protein